jgi:RNA polymerase sigma-70 factor (ECF subfamily)
MPTGEELFTELCPALMKLARRMVGNEAEAEDIVQEAFLRWQRLTTGDIRSPKAFLTTIVTRLCLNHLELARVRLEHREATNILESSSSDLRNPAEHAELADALSEAFVTLLGNLSPTERAVFLLREVFEFEYYAIASVVERSEENCRQILRRARERIAAKENMGGPAPEQHQRVVAEFLNAAETGQVDRLLQLLSDDAALARDGGDLSTPTPPLIRDRLVLNQTLGDSLRQMREASEGFVVFPFGRNFACVARSGRTAQGAILLRVVDQKIAFARLVRCPVLLSQLQILMAVHAEEDSLGGNAHKSN